MTNLEKFLEKSRELREASTKVVAWYAHEQEVRGPFGRWFTCSPQEDECRKGNVAWPQDDCKFTAHAMNTAEAKDEMIRVMVDALKRINIGICVSCDRDMDADRTLVRIEEIAKKAMGSGQ